MTLNDLRRKVAQWDLENNEGSQIADSKYAYILNRLEHYATRDWKVYLPAEHPIYNSNYMERLARWIGNRTSEDEQKLLLEYALCISFFSHDDFVALYRTALNKEITRWVAQQIGATFNIGSPEDFSKVVRYHVYRTTWFCPVTDSMDINEFYKANHLTGMGHRPCFATLEQFALHSGPKNPVLVENVLHYMACPGDPKYSPPLERLVLLEDIVGSGTQSIEAIRWALLNLKKPVLFVPLILCPNGVELLRAEEQKWGGQLSIRPIVQLQRSDLLGPERKGEPGWNITEKMETLAVTCTTEAFNNVLDPFGFGSTGCSLATFANTPDNTLPIVHLRAPDGKWHPLFPRVFRE